MLLRCFSYNIGCKTEETFARTKRVKFLQKTDTEMKAAKGLHDVICLQECAAFVIQHLTRGGGVLEGWQMRKSAQSIVTLVRQGLEVLSVQDALLPEERD